MRVIFGRSRIIAGAGHATRDLVLFLARRIVPAAEGEIVGVAVDPYVVAVGYAKRLGVRWVDVDVHLTGAGRTLVAPVHVAERAEQRRHEIGVDRHGVRTVAIFRRVEDVTEALVPERML